ncbi:hypothetical protein [Serratia liquefaciens]|uniref:hypothetical protein n=1 Tax=Serratia liquefaciens TaxID=614 RepID=UPI0039058C3E
MDNKLSELSKPVAEVRKYYPLGIDSPAGVFFQPLEGLSAVNFGDLLYSQEYVSALLADNEKKEKLLISNAVEYEMDAIDLINRAEEAEKRVAKLEAKLATPVRLPRTLWYEHDDLPREIPVLEKEKVKAAIRAAGFPFTVEGDE